MMISIHRSLFSQMIFSLHLVLLGLFFSLQASGQELRKIDNTAFAPGERLVFRAYYSSALTGNVTAGEASLEIGQQPQFIGGRSTMHIVGRLRTKGLFNLFFKVNDRFETYIDHTAIAPLLFIRRVHEGNYRKSQDVIFNHVENIAISNTATVPVPPYVQDLISVFYFARTLKIEDPKVGDEFNVDFFLDDSVYVTRIVFDGYERLQTRMGTFNTLRFKPMVLEGKVFSQPYPMTLWISEDKNRVPILVESGLVVGSVKLELSEYSGLKNPLKSQVY
ncbi:MAG: DUF3108 domain-containing protein [Bacteroides sp.]|jgi:hypothetical protein|nr:DUF3108 domain-containing protein [Bacteroides sp.]